MREMKQVAVISGKGGTGKTTLVAAFATIADGPVLADCDVDAADLHLLLHPEVRERREFACLRVARINPEACNGCGLCMARCRFGAITSIGVKRFEVDPVLCDGCGVCAHVCQHSAVTMCEEAAGEVYVSDTACGPMVHARLYPGAEASGKLVAEVRKDARRVAAKAERDLVLIDGSPGIGCPVIASLTGVDLAVCVAEPSLSGLHDLRRVVALLDHFRVPGVAVVNKFDVNTDIAGEIEAFCEESGVELAAFIPYDTTVVEALVMGEPATANSNSRAAVAMERAWNLVVRRLDGGDL